MGSKTLLGRSKRPPTKLSPMDGLPPEILNRCLSHIDSEERYLSHIDSEERCQTVPLVSKLFLQNHLDYPPGRKQWGLDGPGSVTASMVQWLLYVAKDSCYPRWDGWKDHPELSADSGLIYFILDNLKGKGGRLLSSLLQFLGRVTETEIYPDIVKKNFRTEFLQRSAGLQSLQVVTFFVEALDHPRPIPDEVDALFCALARIPNLKTLNIDLSSDGENPLSYSREYLLPRYRSVGEMTQIRKLKFGCEDMICFLDKADMLPQSLALLVGLKELDMCAARIPVASCSPIVDLPSLESLKISLEPEDHPAPLLLGSQNLTRLEIIEGSASSVEQYLPAAMPCLRTLKYLALTDMELTTFPNSVARALECLTHLDLSRNFIAKFPPGLARITSLEHLCIGYSRKMQLRLCDGATFAAIPNLQIVDFTWGGTLCKKRNGSRYFAACQFIPHPDGKLQRRNADTWKAITVRHPQLQGLVVGF